MQRMVKYICFILLLSSLIFLDDCSSELNQTLEPCSLDTTNIKTLVDYNFNKKNLQKANEFYYPFLNKTINLDSALFYYKSIDYSPLQRDRIIAQLLYEKKDNNYNYFLSKSIKFKEDIEQIDSNLWQDFNKVYNYIYTTDTTLICNLLNMYSNDQKSRTSSNVNAIAIKVIEKYHCFCDTFNNGMQFVDSVNSIKLLELSKNNVFSTVLNTPNDFLANITTLLVRHASLNLNRLYLNKYIELASQYLVSWQIPIEISSNLLIRYSDSTSFIDLASSCDPFSSFQFYLNSFAVIETLNDNPNSTVTFIVPKSFIRKINFEQNLTSNFRRFSSELNINRLNYVSSEIIKNKILIKFKFSK